MFQKCFAGLRRMLDPDLADAFVIVSMRFELGHQVLRHFRSANGGEALDLGGVEDWQYAWNDRNLDAALIAKIAFHFDEVIDVVEELRDQEISAGIDLFYSPVPVQHFVRTFDVSFGVTGCADADVVTAFDEADKVDG